MISPLRYPGAKRRFVDIITDTIRANNLTPKLYVEPFAGGASVALQLLADNVVESVGLAELDSLLASFWRAVFWDTDWLVRRIRSTKVTLATWRKLRSRPLVTDRDRAFACLYLNRTSFSGILSPTGGPLGGWNQTSAYKLDCRFPRERLVQRIRLISSMRSRIAFVEHASWEETISASLKRGFAISDLFFYLDPPFYCKADRLYTQYFRERDHVALRDALKKLSCPWFLSYDPADRIGELYSENGSSQHVEVLYSAGCNSGRAARKEIIVTNLPVLPVRPFTRMLRSRRRAQQGKA